MTAISVQLIALLQAQGISLAAAVGIAALIGPSQVGARAIDIFIGSLEHTGLFGSGRAWADVRDPVAHDGSGILPTNCSSSG